MSAQDYLQQPRSGSPTATAGQKGSKIFYGWWVVLASGVGLAVHFGPIIVPTFGVFLKPLSQEFGWSRVQISLAFSLATLGLTVVVPFIGRLVDRFASWRGGACRQGRDRVFARPLLLWSGPVGGLTVVAVVLVSLGPGAELDVMPYSDYPASSHHSSSGAARTVAECTESWYPGVGGAPDNAIVPADYRLPGNSAARRLFWSGEKS